LWNTDLEDKIVEKTIKFTKDNSDLVEYVDQDGLNFALQGVFKKLDHKYNYSVEHHPNFRFKNKIKIPKDVVVVHFVGYFDKPWNFISINNSKKLYWKYLRKTPWRLSFYKDLNRLTINDVVIKYKKIIKIAINQQYEIFDLYKKIKNKILRLF
jgi:lipopolysaccharide biosynthesis glycosyltransferase